MGRRRFDDAGPRSNGNLEETLMECRELGAIGDEELFAYIEGAQVPPAFRAHLQGCQQCSSQLAAYQRMDRKLIQKLYRWNCPANQLLGEYQLGLLGLEQAVE